MAFKRPLKGLWKVWFRMQGFWGFGLKLEALIAKALSGLLRLQGSVCKGPWRPKGLVRLVGWVPHVVVWRQLSRPHVQTWAEIQNIPKIMPSAQSATQIYINYRPFRAHIQQVPGGRNLVGSSTFSTGFASSMSTEPPRRSRSPSPQRIRKLGARPDSQPDIETELRQLNDEVATLTTDARGIRAGTDRAIELVDRTSDFLHSLNRDISFAIGLPTDWRHSHLEF
jgi:hypothetical protein